MATAMPFSEPMSTARNDNIMAVSAAATVPNFSHATYFITNKLHEHFPLTKPKDAKKNQVPKMDKWMDAFQENPDCQRIIFKLYDSSTDKIKYTKAVDILNDNVTAQAEKTKVHQFLKALEYDYYNANTKRRKTRGGAIRESTGGNDNTEPQVAMGKNVGANSTSTTKMQIPVLGEKVGANSRKGRSRILGLIDRKDLPLESTVAERYHRFHTVEREDDLDTVVYANLRDKKQHEVYLTIGTEMFFKDNMLDKPTRETIIDFKRGAIVYGTKTTDNWQASDLERGQLGQYSRANGKDIQFIDAWTDIYVRTDSKKSRTEMDKLIEKEESDNEAARKSDIGEHHEFADLMLPRERKTPYHEINAGGERCPDYRRLVDLSYYPPRHEIKLCGRGSESCYQDTSKCFICKKDVKLLSWVIGGADLLFDPPEETKRGNTKWNVIPKSVEEKLKKHCETHPEEPFWYIDPFNYTVRDTNNAFNVHILVQELLNRAIKLHPMSCRLFEHALVKKNDVPLKLHLSMVFGTAIGLSVGFSVNNVAKRKLFTMWRPVKYFEDVQADEQCDEKLIKSARKQCLGEMEVQATNLLVRLSKSFMVFDFVEYIREIKDWKRAWNSIYLFFSRGMMYKKRFPPVAFELEEPQNVIDLMQSFFDQLKCPLSSETDKT